MRLLMLFPSNSAFNGGPLDGGMLRWLGAQGVDLHPAESAASGGGASDWAGGRLGRVWARFAALPHGPRPLRHPHRLITALLLGGIGLFRVLLVCLTRRTDLIHAHWAFPQGLWAVAAGRLMGIPVVFSFHGRHLSKRRLDFELRTMSFAVRNAKGVICDSAHTARKLSRYVAPGVPIRVLGAVVQAGAGDRDLRKPVKEILYVGGTAEDPGLRALIQSLVGVASQVPLHLHVVAEAGPWTAVVPLVERLRLRDQVTYHGSVSRVLVEELQGRADLLVLPPEAWVPGDGLGDVLEQAQCALTPVLASDEGSGSLLKPGGAPEGVGLSRTLLRLLVETDRALEVAQAELKRLRSRLDRDRLGSELLRFYGEVVPGAEVPVPQEQFFEPPPLRPDPPRRGAPRPTRDPFSVRPEPQPVYPEPRPVYPEPPLVRRDPLPEARQGLPPLRSGLPTLETAYWDPMPPESSGPPRSRAQSQQIPVRIPGREMAQRPMPRSVRLASPSRAPEPRRSSLTRVVASAALALMGIGGFAAYLLLPAHLSPNSRIYAGKLGYPALMRILDRPIEVPVEPVQQRSTKQIVAAEGVTAYLNEIPVHSEVPGIVTQLHVEVGQLVKRGTPLLTVNPGGSGTRMIELRRKLREEEAELARTELKREQELAASEISSRARVERSELALRRAETASRLAEEEYAETLRSRSTLVTSLGYAVPSGRGSQAVGISATTEGTIVERGVQLGENLIDLRRRLLVIGDRLVFRAEVDQRYAGFLKVGDEGKFFLRAHPGRPYASKVLRLAHEVQGRIQGSGASTFSVWMSVPEELLKVEGVLQGMNGYATFESVRTGPSIPERALMRYSGRTGTVLVVDGSGTLRVEPVTYVGAEEGWVVLETSGLRAGDKVVVGGQGGLKAGDKVIPKSGTASSAAPIALFFPFVSG